MTKNLAHRATILAATLVAALFLQTPARAHGALAVGVDYRTDGSWQMNVGYGVDYDTRRAAEGRAMDECTAPNRGTSTSRAACKVLTTFEQRCFALAIDSDNGSYGWAIRDDLVSAGQSSIQNCVNHNGRRKLCKISYSGCDSN